MTTAVLPVAQQPPLGFLPRLYAWSLIFESFLFFILGNQIATGFNITVGKTLQITVLVLLLLGRIAYARDIKIVNLTNPAYRYFAVFFVFAVFSGVVGAYTGTYVLKGGYSSEFASSSIARVIRGPATRPFLEYAIYAYYFVYFTILPRYLLRSDQAKAYFFRLFKFGFMACLALGFIDLALEFFGYAWIPRDMNEARHVGFRFHGLAGEPRDAIVYLGFGLAILNLHEYWRRRGSVGWGWVILAATAAIFTQSASGMLGLIFGVSILIAASIRKLSVRQVVSLAGAMVVIFGVMIVSFRSSPRIQAYWYEASPLLESLEMGAPLPPTIFVQMANIYPVWDLYAKAREGNIAPIVMGSGLGTASVVNNNLGGGGELWNPNSQIVRLLYEVGIVGTAILVIAFVYPVKVVSSRESPQVRRRFLIFTCLLVGLFLGHRSTASFIYLGIFLAALGGTSGPLVSTKRSSAGRIGE